MRERICFRNALHPRIRAITHGHKIANVHHMRKVVCDVTHCVHDAVVLEVHGNDVGLEGPTSLPLYVCIYIYLYSYVHISVHVYMYLHVICTYKYTCICVHISIHYICTYKYTCILVHIHVYMYLHVICVYMYTLYTYMYTHM